MFRGPWIFRTWIVSPHRSTGDGGVATSNDYKADAGAWVRRPADWRRVLVFRPAALGFCKGLKKGAQVEVKAGLKSGKSADAEGKDPYSAEILVHGP